MELIVPASSERSLGSNMSSMSSNSVVIAGAALDVLVGAA